MEGTLLGVPDARAECVPLHRAARGGVLCAEQSAVAMVVGAPMHSMGAGIAKHITARVATSAPSTSSLGPPGQVGSDELGGVGAFGANSHGHPSRSMPHLCRVIASSGRGTS